MASDRQDNLAEEDLDINMPSAASDAEPVLEPSNNSAEEVDAQIDMPSKGKKRQRASSNVVYCGSLIYGKVMLSSEIASKAVLTRSAAKGRANNGQVEAMTTSKTHAEGSNDVSKLV